MSYGDYVKIYDVMDSAGILSGDDKASQVTKIATWVNNTFNDIVTAEVVTNNAVRIKDNVCNAGVMWGQVRDSSYQNNRRFIYYEDGQWWDEGSLYYNVNDYPIEKLSLFVCKTEDCYVLDFVNLYRTDYYSYPRFLSAVGTDSNGESKRVCFGSNYYGNGGKYHWSTISQGQITYSCQNWSQADFFMRKNNNLQRLVLTRFAPIAEDIILNNVYMANGVMPPCRSIFTLNGSTFLSLNYNAYGEGCGIALKLD